MAVLRHIRERKHLPWPTGKEEVKLSFREQWEWSISFACGAITAAVVSMSLHAMSWWHLLLLPILALIALAERKWEWPMRKRIKSPVWFGFGGDTAPTYVKERDDEQ
jgi:uncharacterized membrane protein YoaK (UPF0700 family)